MKTKSKIEFLEARPHTDDDIDEKILAAVDFWTLPVEAAFEKGADIVSWLRDIDIRTSLEVDRHELSLGHRDFHPSCPYQHYSRRMLEAIFPPEIVQMKEVSKDRYEACIGGQIVALVRVSIVLEEDGTWVVMTADGEMKDGTRLASVTDTTSIHAFFITGREEWIEGIIKPMKKAIRQFYIDAMDRSLADGPRLHVKFYPRPGFRVDQIMLRVSTSWARRYGCETKRDVGTFSVVSTEKRPCVYVNGPADVIRILAVPAAADVAYAAPARAPRPKKAA